MMDKGVKIAWKCFFEFLTKNTMKIINFEKKKVKLLTKEQKKSNEISKICYICKENFENKYLKVKIT